MKENKISVLINRPTSEVFTFSINPKNTSLWIDSIVVEETNEWPIRLGTLYRNRGDAKSWNEYFVSALKENELFELTSKKGYHVRYTYKKVLADKTEMKYYEWVDEGELEEPFTEATLAKLKRVIEKEK